MSKQQTIPCQEARQLVAAGAQLVDVRSPQEHAQGALPGSVNLPLQTLQDCLHQLDSSKPVIVYCASGMRSQQAAQMLDTDDRTTVYDLGAYQNLVTCQ